MKSDGHQAERLATAVVGLVKQFRFSDRVIVECFDLAALKTVKRLDSKMRVAALFEPELRRPFSVLQSSAMVDLAVATGVNEIAFHHSLVRPSVVAKASSFCLPVVAWTVDDPKWLGRAHSLGLKALITNDPHKLVQARSRGQIH